MPINNFGLRSVGATYHIWNPWEYITESYSSESESTDELLENCYYLRMRGTNQYLRVPDHINLHLTTDLTLAIWATSDFTSNQTIASKYSITGDNRSWIMELDTSGRFLVYLYEDGTITSNHKIYRTTGTFNDGDPHHYAFTWKNGTLLLYVDGSVQAVTLLQDDAMLGIYGGTADIEAGARNGGTIDFLAGSLDDDFIRRLIVADSYQLFHGIGGGKDQSRCRRGQKGGPQSRT